MLIHTATLPESRWQVCDACEMDRGLISAALLRSPSWIKGKSKDRGRNGKWEGKGRKRKGRVEGQGKGRERKERLNVCRHRVGQAHRDSGGILRL